MLFQHVVLISVLPYLETSYQSDSLTPIRVYPHCSTFGQLKGDDRAGIENNIARVGCEISVPP